MIVKGVTRQDFHTESNSGGGRKLLCLWVMLVFPKYLRLSVVSFPNYFLTSASKALSCPSCPVLLRKLLFGPLCSFILPQPSTLKLEHLKLSSFLSYFPHFRLSLGNISEHSSITVDMQMTQRFISPALILICGTLFIFNLFYRISSLKHILSSVRP